MIFLFFSYIGLSQSDSNTVGIFNSLSDSTTIKNDSLKKFMKDFETITYPFEFKEPPNSKEVIDYKSLKHFFNIDKEDLGFENYYYGYVFYESSYLGLIFTRHYSPGAFGIESFFVELITLTYDGEIIDSKELSCLCYNSNFGSNDYYSTEFKIVVNSKKIIVYERNIHATLIQEDSENDFEEITTKISKIDINSVGEINSNKE